MNQKYLRFFLVPVIVALSLILFFSFSLVHNERTSELLTNKDLDAAKVGLQEGKNLNYSILWLTSFQDYLSRMDRFYYDLIEASFENYEGRREVWGPGFEGYKEELSIDENIKQHFGDYCKEFDAIYSSLYHWSVKACGKTLQIHEFGDCNFRGCFNEYNQFGNITIGRYANEIMAIFNQETMKNKSMHLFAHNPDCANEKIFFSNRFEDRKQAAVVFGAISDTWYPLRYKIFHGIKKGKIKANIYEHPGYNFLPNNVDEIPKVYIRNSAFLRNHRQQQIDYANAMKDSKICIFDSSIMKKAIRKFMEASLAGCVVASDIPLDLYPDLSKFIIELDASQSEEEIDNTIQYYLNNPHLLKQKATMAQNFALQHFTCKSKFDRIILFDREYRKGRRGYFFPFGFAFDCFSLGNPNGDTWICPGNN